LVTGTNHNGYLTAILQALSPVMKVFDLPVKSALSQIRKRISFLFFKDLFTEQNEKCDHYRRTWNGLYVYGTDGLQLTLPRSEDIVKAGYSGRKVSKYRESYMPKMFTCAVFDVVNGIVKDFRENTTLDEISDAEDMLQGLEKNSLCLYDRLYISRRMIKNHKKHGNYFLFRLRKSCLKDLTRIFRIKHKRMTVKLEGIEIHVIKIKNTKTGEWDAFATNLPLRHVKEKTIKKLYNLRWEVENSFRDFTCTIQLEQWHSKFINGIRQELYTALWLYNFVKLKILQKTNPEKECMEITYRKPNFKFIFGWITSKLFKILKGTRGVLKDLVELINRSMETRTRRSRSYPRVIKSPASPFPYKNTRWNL